MTAVLEQLQAREQQQHAAAKSAVRAAWQSVHNLALAEIDGATPPSNVNLLQIFDAAEWNAATVKANIAVATAAINSRRAVTSTIGRAQIRAMVAVLAEADATRNAAQDALRLEVGRLEAQRARYSAAANRPDNVRALPEGYTLTPAQEESLRTFPVKARIQKLQAEIIPDAKRSIAAAAEKITSAADRTARTLAQLDHAAAERSVAIAEAELANLKEHLSR